VSEEADFYGAMDGASKFIRGDAVAGIVILLVCMLGGLYVGVRQHGLALGEAAGLFARLTIGDGLVTQIPAFITSVAAALLVTRSGARHDLGEQMIGQLSARPAALGLTAGFMALLLLTGLPKLPLLAVGVGLGGLAWMASRRAAAGGGKSPSPAASSSGTGTGAAGPAGAAPAARDAAPSATGGEELPSVDPLRLEVGYGLIGLVEGPASRELLDGIAAMRRRLAGELGLLVPPIRIVDNMRLPSHVYAICLRGRRVGQGEAYPRQLLAVGGRCDQLSGRSTREPTFGAPATWIAPADREAAEALDCTIVEPARVVVTHLGEVVRAHAADLLPREQVARLVEALRLRAPSLVRDVTDRYPLAAIQKVLRALLRERAPVRDLETILEAMGDWMGDGQNIAGITEHVRSALGGAVGQPYCGDDGRLHCVVLDGRLEQTLSASLQRSRGGQFAPVRPESAQKISAAVGTALGELRRSGKAPVLVCSPALRPMLRQIIAASQPDAAVLAYNEIDSAEVRTVQTVGVEL
jgi:flagellar biosynthesis protein FlhA